MARVLGIGGIFFKANDREKLNSWYKKWLHIPVEEWQGAAFSPQSMPAGGMTIWSPFPASTDYFDPATKEFMINLVVDNLDEALQQVKEGGAEIVGEIEDQDYGRFGWFLDPDGNKVELWEPKVMPK